MKHGYVSCQYRDDPERGTIAGEDMYLQSSCAEWSQALATPLPATPYQNGTVQELTGPLTPCPEDIPDPLE